MDHMYSVSAGGVVPAGEISLTIIRDGRTTESISRNSATSGTNIRTSFAATACSPRRRKGMHSRTPMRRHPGLRRRIQTDGARDSRRADPFWLGALGEMLPRKENRVTINKDRKGRLGNPGRAHRMRLRRQRTRHGQRPLETMKEMADCRRLGDSILQPEPGHPGLCIHEVGTARMGDDPKTSVLNKFNQSWDVKNVFVTDGACFVSQGCQNPTLTMMAITVRACDYIVEEFRRDNI